MADVGDHPDQHEADLPEDFDPDAPVGNEDAEAPPGPPAQGPASRSGHDATETVLNKPVFLPLIDAHCHVSGESVNDPDGAANRLRKRGERPPKPKARALGQKGMTRFGLLGRKSDWRLATIALHGVASLLNERFRLGPEHAVIVPMVMDMGYTPAYVPKSVSKIYKSARRQPEPGDGGPRYYSREERDGTVVGPTDLTWYPRDARNLTLPIEALGRIAARYPGRVWPFAPFDPRRPDCLDHAKHAIESYGFVGVKLYSRCGWLPLGNWQVFGHALGQAIDKRLEALYAYAVGQDLPLLVHASPTGFPPGEPHEIGLPLGFSRHTTEGDRQMMSWSYGDLVPPMPSEGRLPGKATLVPQAVDAVACVLANYCFYVQLTTSPYAWEGVLKDKAGLRLCFGHAGSKLSAVVSGIGELGSNEAARSDCDELLWKNPMVAPADIFKGLFDFGVRKLAETMSEGRINEGQALEVWAKLSKHSDWQKWFDAWRRTYEHDWLTRILALADRHRNVYADLSYVTGDRDSLKAIVGALAKQALAGHKALRNKIILGTDWFMTEMSGLDPAGFWRLLAEAVLGPAPPHPRERSLLWHLWSTVNALQFIRLGPRMGKLEGLWGGGPELPPWWDKLKEFYRV